jgi:hypothetical protein
LRGPYDIGCVFVGVNDVRSPDWDAPQFVEALAAIVAGVDSQAASLLLATIPEDLGRPRAPRAEIVSANRAIAGQARAVGAQLLDLSALRGFPLVLPDAVHLTALGQARVALAAGELLAGTGADVDLGALRETARQPARRSLVRYALGAHAVALARDIRRRAVERAARARRL